MKILVVVAHPDDEILGVGGTLLKHKQKGDDIFVCMVTKAYGPQWSKEYIEQKVSEQQKVDEIIGVKKRFNLNFPTVKLNTIAHGEFNKRITEIVNEVGPDIIYTHFENDLNFDHDLVFRSVMVATRPPTKIKLVCIETLSETEWGNGSFKPNYWVDISDFIEQKIKIFKIYESEVKQYPHPRSPEGIKILAQKRGNEICKKYAEAFQIIKDYN